tara:strand:+ start:328 stop:552 length:225 start_codon:yes stop_codon:yes gene_type:complete
MYLEKASAKIYRHELKVATLTNYRNHLEEFMIKTKLNKTQGKKLLREIKEVDKNIKKRNKSIADSIRLEKTIIN